MSELSEKVIVLGSAGMGRGDEALGQTILGNFLHLLATGPDKPRAVFCYNSGVKLLIPGSPVLQHLQALAERGVSIQACKTCVDFYGLRDQLQVGELSTMAQFLEYVRECEVVGV